MILDDFLSGPHTATVPSGQDEDVQPGLMIGGKRFTRLLIDSTFGHPGTISVGGPGGLVVSTGVDVFHRLEVGYGSQEQLLGVDLNGMTAIRTTFAANDLVVNYNVLLADLLGGWVINGVNTDGVTDVDLLLDEFKGPGIDRDQISAVSLVFQTAAMRAGNDYQVTSLEIV
jgi:hypothetical protein